MIDQLRHLHSVYKLCYLKGKSVPEDYKQAYAWFNVASSQGTEEAKEARDTLAGTLPAQTLIEAQALSNEYYKKLSQRSCKNFTPP